MIDGLAGQGATLLVKGRPEEPNRRRNPEPASRYRRGRFDRVWRSRKRCPAAHRRSRTNELFLFLLERNRIGPIASSSPAAESASSSKLPSHSDAIPCCPGRESKAGLGAVRRNCRREILANRCERRSQGAVPIKIMGRSQAIVGAAPDGIVGTTSPRSRSMASSTKGSGWHPPEARRRPSARYMDPALVGTPSGRAADSGRKGIFPYSLPSGTAPARRTRGQRTARHRLDPGATRRRPRQWLRCPWPLSKQIPNVDDEVHSPG